MQGLSTTQTAALLGVSDATVLSWVERFDFPRSCMTAEGRMFVAQDVLALKRALSSGHSVTAAMLGARVTADSWGTLQDQFPSAI